MLQSNGRVDLLNILHLLHLFLEQKRRYDLSCHFRCDKADGPIEKETDTIGGDDAHLRYFERNKTSSDLS
jgi:hypothetical protein